ncbi:NAD(P)H-hydrate dehydratase [Brevundimonas sp.]|uniref:NAD(P)H-hydrate dehydratase n=1 Tax=Brevundimonas sp. TaxID=1871086 RepID=UPI0024899D64|nr:NAD(P)H-hydrate dehydratase [Brevundimonas sp.]MDI1282141.1 NAD(P)H-hydrate dehydratase [Brevundimonas sp.]
MTGDQKPHDWRTAMPWPGPETHKHARGRLGVVSGRSSQTGAARLAARGGLRIGAGVVSLLCPVEAVAVLAPAVEAVMLKPFGDPEVLAELAEGLDAVVIGPAAGINDATVAHVQALAGTGAALVIDADGLTVFAGWPTDLFAVLDRDDVLTPHEGEFRRLFPDLLALGREQAATEAAVRAGAVIVLKGPRTVIAAPDGRRVINDNGTPWLATAGSGDVLAGMIGGLLAQRMDSFDAACAAVWIHAEAAAGFGPGLIAEDLPDRLPAVLARLWPGQ